MRKSILLPAVMLNAMIATAQTASFNDIKKIEYKNAGYILEMDNPAGYYAFYKVDKEDRKNDAYAVRLLDNNLTPQKSIDVVRPSGTALLESVFNGTTFMMAFFKKDAIEFVTFDKSGRQLGTKTVEDISIYEKMKIKQVVEDGTANSFIYPMGANAFVRTTLVKNSKTGFQVEAYDNNVKSLWKYASDPKSEMMETVDIIGASEKHVMMIVAKKKSAMTKKADMSFVFVDAGTGKLLFEKPLFQESDLTLLSANIDEAKGEVLLIGEFFRPGDEVMNGKSQGLYLMQLDMSGKQLSYKKLGWESDLNKYVKVDEDGKQKGNPAIYFHKVQRTGDGSIIMIGEQYKKVADALGIAAAAMGGSANDILDAKIMDMVVVELDPSLNLKGGMTVPKKSSIVGLPSGYGYMPMAMLGHVIKAMRSFDYSFTTTDKARGRFFTIYADRNRKAGDDSKEKSDAMIGVITYEDGKVVTNRIPVNTDANYMWIAPGKPGHVAVVEYFKRKKTLTYRLEKLNF